MIYGFGGRADNDSNAVTMIDEENRTALTKGYINGEFVEFSGGSGGSMMVVNIHRDFNSPDNNSIDKTFNELKSAIQNGVPVYARILLVQNDTILGIASANSVGMRLLAQYGQNDQITFESTGYTTAEGRITNISTTTFTLLSDDTLTTGESYVDLKGE